MSSRSWWTRVDPLGPACALGALAVYLPHGFDGELTRDLGVYAYAGQQVADGVPPYVAILNRAGPLAHLVPGMGALAARVVGADEITGMRVLFMLLSIAAIWVAYLLGRRLFDSRWAGLACAVAMLSFQGFTEYATYGPREKTAMVLFLLCALLAVAHRRWATTGFFIALATLTWQPVFFAVLPGAVVALLLSERDDRWRALLRLGIGGLVPTAVVVAAYAALGHLTILFDSFLLINARYTEQGSQLLLDPHGFWLGMTDAYGWSLWVFLVGSAALWVTAAMALLRRADRQGVGTAGLVGTAVAHALSVVWSLRAFNAWPDAFVMLPCAAVGIGSLAAVAARGSARWAAGLTTAWAVVAVSLSLVHSVGDRDTSLHEQRTEVRAVTGRLPAGETIFSVGAPQAMALSGHTQPVRHQMFASGLDAYVDDTWPGGLDGYGRWIGRREPPVIALGIREVPLWLAPTLEESYARVGRTGGFTWYVRRELGRSTLQAVRADLRE